MVIIPQLSITFISRELEKVIILRTLLSTSCYCPTICLSICNLKQHIYVKALVYN